MIQSQTLLFSTFPQATQMHKLSPYSPGAGTLQYTMSSDDIFIHNIQCLCTCKYLASVRDSSGGKWDSLRVYLPTALPNGIFLNFKLSLKWISEREVVVSMERGIKSFRCIIMRSMSSIPVGVSSCTFFLVSASRKAGPRAPQFMAGFAIADTGSGVTRLGAVACCSLSRMSLQSNFLHFDGVRSKAGDRLQGWSPQGVM